MKKNGIFLEEVGRHDQEWDGMGNSSRIAKRIGKNG